MTTATKKTAEEWLREHIGTEALASYLMGDSGETFAVNPDGSTYVSGSAGMEIAEEDRPVFTAKCRGIGNFDMSWFREGWDCGNLTDEEVIADCCENGDVSGEIDGLIEALLEYADDSDFVRVSASVTYCVCGQEPDGPWETVEDDMDSLEAAEDWLRENFARFPEYTAWYVDRTDNENHAEAYWDVRDGGLVRTN